MTIAFIMTLSLLLVWSAGSYFFGRSIETQKYKLLVQKDGYEIRQYESIVIAETEAEGTYDEASKEGFRILAAYIFGGNAKRSSLAMTTPVSILDADGEKLAMTTPVTEKEKAGNIHLISFTMPSGYTLQTLPQPNDPRVALRQVPPKKMAALRFSWYATARRVTAKKAELKRTLSRDAVTMLSEPYVARYNAPFTAPFFNRNEILIEVKFP